MAFPKTIDELVKAGYKHENVASCRGRTCTARIEWWITPSGKKLPLDVDAKGNVEPHWAHCPDSKDFRK